MQAFLKTLYTNCRICPRNCGVDRTKGELGVCGASDTLTVASYNLHFGEEPPISGTRGSGTIFFGNCSLRCIFCQNYPISQLKKGLREVSVSDLANMMLELQARGAHNINFVTPTHYIPSIIAAIEDARARGLSIPIVYNSSGYEKAEIIKLLDGYVDIYMPDFKYADESVARKYSAAPDYQRFAEEAIAEMLRQVGHLQLDDEGIAYKGLLIRHLVLPGHLDNSKKVLERIRGLFGAETYISLMNQYFPAYKALNSDINRTVSPKEYKKIVDYFENLGFNNGYIQGFEEVALW